MRIVATFTFLGIALYVVGLIEHDFLMADVGASAFILGSMVVGAMSLWKRHKQRRLDLASETDADRVSLTAALTESAVRSLNKKKDGDR
jgi:hypothetical protein